MSALFEPLRIRGVDIRNRIWVAPLCQYSVRERDGVPTDWHLVHLGAMASGGAGLVMAEATAVHPDGRISDADTGIWNDAQASAWARVVRFLHDQGAAAGVQLAHAGRKASTWPGWGQPESGAQPFGAGGWAPVAPSAVGFEGLHEPRALDEAGILAVIRDFADAAERAVSAGFDVVELHGAHGYLLHEFLSPLSNHRTDQWGGRLENRARLLLEVVRAVRERVGDRVAVFVRFSATDYAPGGWDEHQTALVAGWASEAGADFFDISSGGNVAGVPIPIGPGYQVPLAQFVGERSGAAVNAVGLITSAHQAEEIVASGRADAVMLGREMMRDPHFALRAAHELGVDVDYWPPQYLRARPNGSHW